VNIDQPSYGYLRSGNISCCFVPTLQVDKQNALWTRNKAGLSHSHQHGFGLMSAWRMVNAARVWSLAHFTSNNISVVDPHF